MLKPAVCICSKHSNTQSIARIGLCALTVFPFSFTIKWYRCMVSKMKPLKTTTCGLLWKKNAMVSPMCMQWNVSSMLCCRIWFLMHLVTCRWWFADLPSDKRVYYDCSTSSPRTGFCVLAPNSFCKGFGYPHLLSSNRFGWVLLNGGRLLHALSKKHQHHRNDKWHSKYNCRSNIALVFPNVFLFYFNADHTTALGWWTKACR